ncbi:MAG: hypothetical protein C0490_28695, partial [Marivirga sp.]|nr:hypothetical protein [Marivirga sp.]
AVWFYSGGSANANFGTVTGPEFFSGYTFASGFDGWFNTANNTDPSTGGTTANWAWSSSFGGSLKVTTIDTYGCKALRLSNVVVPQEAFDIVIDGTGLLFFNSPGLALRFIIRDASNNQLFNQQFSQFGTFNPFATMHITSSSIWTNADHFLITVSSTDFNVGDDIYISDFQIITASATTSVFSTNRISQGGISLGSFTHTVSANVTFGAGTSNKLYLQLKDISSTSIGSPVQMISANSGTFTGSTSISAVNSPNVYSAEFWVVGQSGITQTVKINELSLKAVIESNEYSQHKIFKFDYEEPETTFQVAFLSKMGVYETFVFKGATTEVLERTSKNYTIP